MKRTTKMAIVAASTSVTMATAVVGIASTGASAIDAVPCDSNDYVDVTFHYDTEQTPPSDACFANGGQYGFPKSAGQKIWVTKIWTGNNRVQWWGDQKVQPDQPIGKWTTYTWPNNPGGVRLDSIIIV